MLVPPNPVSTPWHASGRDWRGIGTATLDRNAAALMANGILSRVAARETLAALMPILDAAKGRPTPEMQQAAAAMILPCPSPETIRRAEALFPVVMAASQAKPRIIAAPWPGFRSGEAE
ncbi:MAG: hypothetical protein M0006_05355 [Magnetospirillum sp.]|nr:hypothetical protein [Magnetospirillum sp.]